MDQLLELEIDLRREQPRRPEFVLQPGRREHLARIDQLRDHALVLELVAVPVPVARQVAASKESRFRRRARARIFFDIGACDRAPDAQHHTPEAPHVRILRRFSDGAQLAPRVLVPVSPEIPEIPTPPEKEPESPKPEIPNPKRNDPEIPSEPGAPDPERPKPEIPQPRQPKPTEPEPPRTPEQPKEKRLKPPKPSSVEHEDRFW